MAGRVVLRESLMLAPQQPGEGEGQFEGSVPVGGESTSGGELLL